jgi:hypothetical protein
MNVVAVERRATDQEVYDLRTRFSKGAMNHGIYLKGLKKNARKRRRKDDERKK